MAGITITALGTDGLLLDVAGPVFDEALQARLLALAAALRGRDGVLDVVPGMNNLMLGFDPDHLPPPAAEALLREGWANAVDAAPQGRLVEIPVVYGGAAAEDLRLWADHCGLSPDEAIRRHAAPIYRVAAIGAMPGFPYLSGLDPRLAMGRRAVPRARVAQGAIIIGGAQAGIMPITAPSGWHIIGQTDLRLFDPQAARPCLLAPGDRLRFVVSRVLA